MKIKLPRQQVEPYALWMLNFLSAHCHRIEIAGSLRRCRPEVGDIEIVAIPKNSLYVALDNLIDTSLLRHADPKRWGLKLRSFILNTGNITDTIIDGHKYLNWNEGYQIDLFLQPDPATWGIQGENLEADSCGTGKIRPTTGVSRYRPQRTQWSRW